MPWQSLAPLVVVGTMFNVAAGLVAGIHYVSYGVRSPNCTLDQFDHTLSHKSRFVPSLFLFVVQKSKELGFHDNEFNYRMDKRDQYLKQLAKSVK
jgi:hypothetical protein